MERLETWKDLKKQKMETGKILTVASETMKACPWERFCGFSLSLLLLVTDKTNQKPPNKQANKQTTYHTNIHLVDI